MSVLSDIAQHWRAPRATMRARLAEGPREDRALATVMGACMLIFVAELPGLARAAHLDPSVPLDARLGGALLALLFMVPLILYVVAGASHVILRLTGGRGTPYGARLALFSSLLAASPLMLVQGMVKGLAGPGLLESLLGLMVLAGFLYLWVLAMAEVRLSHGNAKGAV